MVLRTIPQHALKVKGRFPSGQPFLHHLHWHIVCGSAGFRQPYCPFVQLLFIRLLVLKEMADDLPVGGTGFLENDVVVVENSRFHVPATVLASDCVRVVDDDQPHVELHRLPGSLLVLRMVLSQLCPIMDISFIGLEEIVGRIDDPVRTSGGRISGQDLFRSRGLPTKGEAPHDDQSFRVRHCCLRGRFP